MSGEIEFGICPICGKKGQLERKYYRYDFKCECHSPKHFELVFHCKDCEPEEPHTTIVTTDGGYKYIVPTSILKKREV